MTWLLWLPIAAILPGAAVFLLLDTHWNFDANPIGAWSTLAIVPLLIWPILVLRRVRLAGSLVGLQAIVAAALLSLGLWQGIAGYWLALDLLLAFALFGSLGGRRPGGLGKSTVVLVAVLFGLGLPLAMLHSLVLAWRAEATSAARPYCIQTADNRDLTGYREAASLLDLSVLRVNAPWWQPGTTPFQFQFHAVLVVQGDVPEFLNWSYNREAFVAEVPSGSRPRLYCTPQRNFARKLAVWSAGSEREQAVSIGQRRFAIPRPYRPGGVDNKYVLIKASGPDYRPEDPTARIVDRYFNPNVYISDGRNADLARRHKQLLALGAASAAVTEFGLQRIDVSVRPGALNRVFVGTDDTGRITRLLGCSRLMSRDEKDVCDFDFIADGLAFHLVIPEPGRWQDAERRLTDLLRSWQR